MKKVDTTIGYINKPKPQSGYSVERYYCECGCKKGYWHYVKKKAKRTVKFHPDVDKNKVKRMKESFKKMK